MVIASVPSVTKYWLNEQPGRHHPHVPRGEHPTDQCVCKNTLMIMNREGKERSICENVTFLNAAHLHRSLERKKLAELCLSWSWLFVTINEPHDTVWSCGFNPSTSICRLGDGGLLTYLFSLSISKPQTTLPIVWEGSCRLGKCVVLGWRGRWGVWIHHTADTMYLFCSS